ncbi:MAG: DUF2306 domain-containing protein [Mycobacterium sp.]|nr:DUF2306 domain-containing protein [Mycobacterium sp.]
MDDHRRIAVSRGFFIATIAVTVCYVPLALNYTLPLFAPGMSRWQDTVNTLINGREYALGDGSVEAVRHAAYAEHRVVMLVHTTLGAVALALAMFQFSTRLRERQPAIHRWIGRAYLVLMSISMLTALMFLLATPPAQHFIGPAFETQLRALAMGTFGSAWYAVYAIRHRDVVRHRAWMTYSVAFMLTAPLLRIIWIAIQPVIPQHDLLTNIGAASLILGVAAPGAAVVAFMLNHRTSPDAAIASASQRVYAAVLIVAVVGSLAYAGLALRLPAPIPRSLAAFHLVPAWIAILVTLAAVHRARAQRNPAREQWLRRLLWGFAVAPTAASLFAQIVPPAFTPADAIIAGGMDAPGIPITIAFGLVVRAAARSRARADDQPEIAEVQSA